MAAAGQGARTPKGRGLEGLGGAERKSKNIASAEPNGVSSCGWCDIKVLGQTVDDASGVLVDCVGHCELENVSNREFIQHI